MNICKVLVAFTAFAVTLQLAFAASTNYTVGAPGGSWDLSTNYTKWASDITFYPGDNLIFSYTSAHDVWEVSKSDYETCNIGSPIKQYSGGNTVVALTEIGSKYFYCSVSGHCSNGMKLAVTVVSTTEPSTPSPPPPPPPPPPPSPNGAAAVNGVGTRSALTALVLGATWMIFV